MRYSTPFVLVTFCLLLSYCKPEGGNQQKILLVKTSGIEKKLSLSELKSRFGYQTVTVDDYYLKRSVQYQAIAFKKLLRAFVMENPGFDELIFRCADGYLAHVSRIDFEAGKLDSFFLAFGEDGDTFKSKIPQGKAEIYPEPFYAVATDKAGFQTLSWPYELIGIEFVNFKQMFPALYFSGLEKDLQAKKGFDLFRKECLKCHSLNLQGGDIGPELNIPQNVTEYHDEKFLHSFIHNASAYRAKSKMPPFLHLKDAEISAILRYLKAMSNHKIYTKTE